MRGFRENFLEKTTFDWGPEGVFKSKLRHSEILRSLFEQEKIHEWENSKSEEISCSDDMKVSEESAQRVNVGAK